nr:unnamed protein product [Callosobruchus chinensis]
MQTLSPLLRRGYILIFRAMKYLAIITQC